VPSHASQTMMDVSLFWQEELSSEYLNRFYHLAGFRNADPERKFKIGEVFNDSHPAWLALARLGGWLGGTWLLTLLALAWREHSG